MKCKKSWMKYLNQLLSNCCNFGSAMDNTKLCSLWILCFLLLLLFIISGKRGEPLIFWSTSAPSSFLTLASWCCQWRWPSSGLRCTLPLSCQVAALGSCCHGNISEGYNLLLRCKLPHWYKTGDLYSLYHGNVSGSCLLWCLDVHRHWVIK